ncbi:Serine/threonine-protein kinase HT1 [Leucoagaricus sp. SymC.cos]|nr:Serine/threonine-protein kinase HT1 [Leucoagaricus sp. SymC.cos]
MVNHPIVARVTNFFRERNNGRDTEEANISRLKRKDIVIVVVHPSDAGKTTFIERASEKINKSSEEMGPFMIHRLVVEDTGNPSFTPDVILIDAFVSAHQDDGTLENLSQRLQDSKINISGILWMRKSQDDPLYNKSATITMLCRDQETNKVIVATTEAPKGESPQVEGFQALHLEEKWESAWRILGLLVARELKTRWQKVESDLASLKNIPWWKFKKEKIVPQIVLDQIPKIREKLDGVEKSILEGGSEPDSLTTHLAILRQQQSLQNNALSRLRMKKLIAGTTDDMREQRHLRNLLIDLVASAKVIPGRYKLKDIHLDQSNPVAQGGFAVVYKGTWRNQSVGLKDRAKELTLWAHLSHPNILELYGVFTIKRQLALVSPWMSGGNLQSYVRKDPGKPKIPLILKITEGLNYLHSVGIIHGDLKGSNVLMSGGGEPVIADFGLSRTTVNTMTGVGSRESGFTGRWAAPETLVASDEPTRPTQPGDIWGLACVMYEAVSCKLPYDQYHRPEQVVTAICVRNEPPGQRAGTDKELDGLWALMEKCWDRDPNGRPTCQNILDDLRKLGPSQDLPAASEAESGGAKKEIAIVKLSRSDYERVLAIYARVISKYFQASSTPIDPHGESSNLHPSAVSGDEEKSTQVSRTRTDNLDACLHALIKFFCGKAPSSGAQTTDKIITGKS